MKLKPLINKAAKKISVRNTPLEFSPSLSKLSGAKVYLKLENYQLTGSFKIRGAMNKILSLTSQQRKKGIVTASSGNHGLGVAYAMKKTNTKGTIYLPKNASKAKVKALMDVGANIKFHGTDCEQTEDYAKKMGKERFISPYNDLDVIAGQGTIGKEILDILTPDYVLASVGGGGLISGIAGYVKESTKKTKVIGCQPKNSKVMFDSIKRGRITNTKSKPTLSDGTAGGIEEDSITFKLNQKYVDDYITTTEPEIKHAIKLIANNHRMIIEGSAGVAVASLLNDKRFKNNTVVIILCGRNIDMDIYKKII